MLASKSPPPPPEHDPYTGLTDDVCQRAVRDRWVSEAVGRARTLRNALVDGASREVPTTQRVAAMRKNPPPPHTSKFVRERAGCKGARRLEQLDHVGGVV